MPDPETESPHVWTIEKVLRWTHERFAARGLSSPRLDAELLLGHALGRSRVELYTGYDQPLSPDELRRARQLIRGRLDGVPVAYLTGKKEFWSLTLKVSEAVLVPRPETEVLVDVALALVLEMQDLDWETSRPHRTASPRIADIGTGSGAVALALRKELPAATVMAVDCSAAALEVARENAAALALDVQLFEGDLLSPLVERGPFDLIVSNPPYVPARELAGLAPEVRVEPRVALDGGADGLQVIRRLVTDARPLLVPGGALVLEVGSGQAQAVLSLLGEAGYVSGRAARDLAGIERVVSGRSPPSPLSK